MRAMLAATTADGLHAVIAVVASRGQAHADTILRSMVEALGDLYHLRADAAYLQRLKLTSAVKIKTDGEAFIEESHDDPALRHLVELTKSICREAGGRSASLSKSYKVIGPPERVRAPGLPPQAVSMYGQLSFDAHHDIIALQRRHLHDGNIHFGTTLSPALVIGTLSNAVLVVAMVTNVARDIADFDDALYHAKAGDVFRAAEQLSQLLAAATALSRDFARAHHDAKSNQTFEK
jgi:hypothetical protein